MNETTKVAIVEHDIRLVTKKGNGSRKQDVVCKRCGSIGMADSVPEGNEIAMKHYDEIGDLR